MHPECEIFCVTQIPFSAGVTMLLSVSVQVVGWIIVVVCLIHSKINKKKSNENQREISLKWFESENIIYWYVVL